MRSLVFLSMTFLAACSSAGAKEEQKYDMVLRQTEGQFQPYKARCEQAKSVAATYLDERNDPKYREWKLKADVDCGLSDVSY